MENPKDSNQEHSEPSSGEEGWFLICPPDNWQEPISLEEEELRLLELLGQRLELTVNRDEARQKIFVGLSRQNRLEKSHQTETPSKTKPRSGLRFGNGWVADIVPDHEAGPGYQPVDPTRAAPLIRAFPDAQVSKNFRLSEFRPGEHSYDLIRISPMLVSVLEEIRKQGGDYPITVTSCYRPPAYNRKVGGVSNSTHMDGIAADIFCDHLSTADIHYICDRVIGDRGGVGYYPIHDFVHVDLRGYRARWTS